MEVKKYFIQSWTDVLTPKLKTVVDLGGCFRYNGLNKARVVMTAQEFRSLMIEKIRAFDKWAYKDQLDNPQDYNNVQLGDWWSMFVNYVENDL